MVTLETYGFTRPVPPIPAFRGIDPYWCDPKKLNERFRLEFENINGDEKMTSLREQALQYEPPKTLNICDLEKVDANAKIESKTFQGGKDGEFTVDVINVDGNDYRVPKSVIKQLNLLLVDKPELTHFRVKKQGEGLDTMYFVIAL